MSNDLRRLALLHGIQPDWSDVFGKEQQVPDASLEALLRNFDVDAGNPGSLRDSIARAESDAWRTAAPPVLAVEADRAGWVIPLRIPVGMRQLHWSVSSDGKAPSEGVLVLDDHWSGDEADVAGRRVGRCLAPLGIALSAGYHHLRLREFDTETLIIAAPARAQSVGAGGNAKVWGPAVQLYAIRSARNWGIGDFSDLLQLVESWAGLGAGIVGLNPLHAMFSAEPEHASPYSPSSRRWLNTIYLDVTAIDDFAECPEATERVASAAFQARLQAARAQPLVDYTAVAELKREVLDLLHRSFRARHAAAGTARAQAFAAFQEAGGDSLRGHALFEALDAHFHETGEGGTGGSGHGWTSWPEPLRDPASSRTLELADLLAERIEFFQYLQWQADLQLSRVQQRCKSLGMPIGLYLDIAVSVDPAGSDTWAHADLFAKNAGIGAPPDEFNPKGQGWGLAPLRPDRLRASRHRFFIDTVSGVMRLAGAVRIDHVMGLMRLFWVPQGRDASEGAYVHQPFDELLGIVKLESARHGTVVVGEDLGTVDPGVQRALGDGGVLSYRLVYFERKSDGSFKPSHEYPPQALAAISTHDLPTFAGWWAGRDLDVRQALHLFPSASLHASQSRDRALDRQRLVETLRHAGLLTDDAARALEPLGVAPPSPELVTAAHAFLGATPSQLAMVQLEDLTGTPEQANLPGTTTEHPNWRRKLEVDLDAMAGDAFIAPLAGLRQARA